MRKVSYEQMLFMDTKPQGFCVSFYASNSVELDRLIDEAKLVALQDLKPDEYSQLFQSVESNKKFIDCYPVAMFICSDMPVFVPLIECSEELFVVSTSFHIKPLIKMHQRNINLALLSFSENKVQLFQVSMKDIILLDVFEIPVDAQSYIDIDRFVSSHLANKKPLLLVSGMQVYADKFMSMTQYGKVFPNRFKISRKFKKMNLINEIYRHLDSYFRSLELKSLKRIELARQKGKMTNIILEIFNYAKKGQVKTLFVSEEKKIWGYINNLNENKIGYSKQMDSYDDDIIDDLSEIVLQFKGNVVVVADNDMPDGAFMCAILRDSYEKIIFDKKIA